MNIITHGCDEEGPCKISNVFNTVFNSRVGGATYGCCVLWEVRKHKKMYRPSVRPSKLAKLVKVSVPHHFYL